MNACNEKYCKEGFVCNREFLDIVQYTRKMAAELINADPSEITFVKNTTQGIHIAANGIRYLSPIMNLRQMYSPGLNWRRKELKQDSCR